MKHVTVIIIILKLDEIILQLDLSGVCPCCPFHVVKEGDHISDCVVLFLHAFGGLVQMLRYFFYLSLSCSGPQAEPSCPVAQTGIFPKFLYQSKTDVLFYFKCFQGK